jgi:undecaprenyl-diphosphatase
MDRRVAVGLALIAAALAIGLWVVRSGTPGFDPAIIRALAGQREWASLWLGVTRVGDGEVRFPVALLVVGWLAWRKRGRDAAALFATVAALVAVNSGLKAGFGRARPELLPHLDTVSDLAFPSGHAAQTAVVYVLIALLVDRRLLAFAIPFTLLVGVSRVILGVHWPSDVIGGWLEGTGFALIGWAIARPRPAVRG